MEVCQEPNFAQSFKLWLELDCPEISHMTKIFASASISPPQPPVPDENYFKERRHSAPPSPASTVAQPPSSQPQPKGILVSHPSKPNRSSKRVTFAIPFTSDTTDADQLTKTRPPTNGSTRLQKLRPYSTEAVTLPAIILFSSVPDVQQDPSIAILSAGDSDGRRKRPRRAPKSPFLSAKSRGRDCLAHDVKKYNNIDSNERQDFTMRLTKRQDGSEDILMEPMSDDDDSLDADGDEQDNLACGTEDVNMRDKSDEDEPDEDAMSVDGN